MKLILTLLKAIFFGSGPLGEALKAADTMGPELLTFVDKNQDMIKSLLRFIASLHESQQQKAMDDLARGFKIMEQTGETHDLEKTLRDHTSHRDGLRI